MREGQIHKLSLLSKRGQKAAKLAQDPNRFLSSVQIGVTLATLVSGVYGSATLVSFLESGLKGLGLSPDWTSAVAFIVVTVGITFITLILGELRQRCWPPRPWTGSPSWPARWSGCCRCPPTWWCGSWAATPRPTAR